MAVDKYDNLKYEDLGSQEIDSNVVLDDSTIAETAEKQPDDGYYRFANAMINQAVKDNDTPWFTTAFAAVCCDVMGFDAGIVYQALRRRARKAA